MEVIGVDAPIRVVRVGRIGNSLGTMLSSTVDDSGQFYLPLDDSVLDADGQPVMDDQGRALYFCTEAQYFHGMDAVLLPDRIAERRDRLAELDRIHAEVKGR